MDTVCVCVSVHERLFLGFQFNLWQIDSLMKCDIKGNNPIKAEGFNPSTENKSAILIKG